MVRQVITIGHLYPKQMNIYGDTGNVLVLAKRLEWRGIHFEVIPIGAGDEIPSSVDILVSGGGQDQGQIQVEADLQTKKSQLHALAEDGVSMLVICGTYQLFGHRFVTGKGNELRGISLLDVETFAGEERLIGNIAIESAHGVLVGYENHSGKTYLGKGSQALGSVVLGAGNNGEDGTEGARSHNVIGTYLHGPILPKNPQLADELIRQAMLRKFGKADLQPLEDSLENRAKDTALTRPR